MKGNPLHRDGGGSSRGALQVRREGCVIAAVRRGREEGFHVAAVNRGRREGWVVAALRRGEEGGLLCFNGRRFCLPLGSAAHLGWTRARGTGRRAGWRR